MNESENRRFWSHVDVDANGCWLWTAAIQSGYGKFRALGENSAHRYAFVTHVGPIPPYHDVHHLCGVRHCVNPQHLEAISRYDHVLATPGTWGNKALQRVGDRDKLNGSRRRPYRGWGARKSPLINLFWRHIEITADGCWQWTATVREEKYGDGLSYGIFHVHRDGMNEAYAHRVSYRMHIGLIPSGYHVDHLCKNRACCNPEHLAAVPPETNNLRSDSASAVNARKVVCRNGHAFTEQNTWIETAKSGRLARHCRRCHADREARRRAHVAAGISS